MFTPKPNVETHTNSLGVVGYASRIRKPTIDDLKYSAIYIVDSSLDDYLDIHDEVENSQVQIKLFATASQALRIPRYQAPLFYVVNTSLPDMDGFDLREMLVERWPKSPGYLVSDTYDPQSEIRARCSGATLFFCKPLRPGWLAAAMRPTPLPDI